MPTSVLIVDDHEVVRQGLRAVLEDEEDLVLVGEAGTFVEAMARARELRPDVAIVDLSLPGANGLHLMREMGNELPDTRTLVLSMHTDEAYLTEAMRVGAKGYIVKGAPSAEIVLGLRIVAAGGRFFSSGIAESAISAAVGDPNSKSAFSSLTDRQLDVLRLIGKGLTSKQIADKLGLGARTIESHRQHLLHKLKLRSSSDLIAYAVAHDLLSDVD
jgi:DNA-binding NarL/FixJ family response regulator